MTDAQTAGLVSIKRNVERAQRRSREDIQMTAVKKINFKRSKWRVNISKNSTPWRGLRQVIEEKRNVGWQDGG